MSTGAFSIDQLMELAGLSVSQAGQSWKSIRLVSRGEFRADMLQYTEFTPSIGAKESWLLLALATTVGVCRRGVLLASALTNRPFRG